ncbi:unnamed protein product [Polarella glacialis]|uniref:Aurora kinase n=2 Tax=Polarella glacialis TaxID=89957 RepID=A0A813EAI0_POLGL|nr:unnamed protein product [Polarella glacialis]
MARSASPSPVAGRLASPSSCSAIFGEASSLAEDGFSHSLSPSLMLSPSPSPALGQTRRMWCLADFQLGPRIGAGTFGHIQLAKETRSRAVVALKVVKKRRVERMRTQRHLAREVDIQAHLRHENVLRLFGFFWDESEIYMILEHAPGGDLFQLLQRQPGGCFSSQEAAGLVSQIACAVQTAGIRAGQDYAIRISCNYLYCHRMHIMHRDLKPQNLLLVPPGPTLKLADFGWAVHTHPDERRWTLCGTLDYLSPEMVRPVSGHSFGVDLWALGILAYELTTGGPPFRTQSYEETYRRILAASPEFPEDLPEGPRNFVKQMLRAEPGERMSLLEASRHPWLEPESCASENPEGSTSVALCWSMALHERKATLFAANMISRPAAIPAAKSEGVFLQGWRNGPARCNGQDVFVNRKECGGFCLAKGQEVQFTIATNDKGSHATEVRVLGSGEEAQYHGEIKSFNGQKGYGFIGCDAFPGQDVFVLMSQIPGGFAPQGGSCKFKVKVEEKGPAASEVQLLGAAGDQYQSMKGYGKGYGMGDMWGKGFGKGFGKGDMFGGKGFGKGKGSQGPRVDPSQKVWIGGLPEGASWKELQEHMEKAGKVKWCEVFAGKGAGTGTVAYNSTDDVAQAIGTLNGSVFAGQTIQVDSWVKTPKDA